MTVNAVDRYQQAAIEDYARRELYLRHEAAEAERLGDTKWADTCRAAAVRVHCALVNETVNRRPDGLESFEPLDHDSREGR